MNLRLALLSLCFTSALHAGEAPKTPPPAPPAQEQLSSVKDEFLRFTLDKAQKYSGKLESGIGAAVDEAQKQAPELAKEFLLWRFLLAASDVGIPLILALISIWAAIGGAKGWIRVWKEADVAANARADGRRYPEWAGSEYLKCWRYGPLAIGGALASIITLGFTVGNLGAIGTMIEIYFAPRIYIADQILSLIKH